VQVILYFASILLTCALSGFLAAYGWKQRSVPGARTYAGLALGECLLALAETLSLLSPTLAQALFWFQVRFLALAAIPVLWLVFALEYSGRRAWLSKRFLAGLFVIPLITQVLLWSNSLHGLWVRHEVGFHRNGPFWIAETSARIPGLWFLTHSLYGMILLLAGIVLLLISAWRMRRLYRGQALLVAGAGFTALVFAIINTFNLLPRIEFNLFTPGIGLSMLLIALAVFRFQFLKRAPAAEANAAMQAREVQEQRALAVFLLIFVMMAAGIAAVGYLSFQNYERQLRIQVESKLSSIAALKVDELQSWRKERLADAEVLHQNPAFSERVQRYLENPADAPTQAALQSWLDKYQAYDQYDRVFLLDTEGVERISSPAVPEPVATHLVQDAKAALNSGQVTFLDFYRDTTNGPIHLSLLVPIYAEQDNRPLGVLVLRIDPSVYLYPLIQQWPVSSASAEITLVRREGDYALYLNELRFQANIALNQRIPLENTERPSVKAALGQTGLLEGLDYRGVPVIADVRAVPDSSWFLVARMDTTEVYAPLQERLWLTVIFFGALMATSGAALGLAWRQQRARYYHGQIKAAQALRESEARLRLALDAAKAGTWEWDLQTNENIWSEELWKVYGLEMHSCEPSYEAWRQTIHPDDRAKAEQAVQTAASNGTELNAEWRVMDRDGTERWLMSRGQPLRDADSRVVRYIGTVLDITERKQAEEALRALSGRQQALLSAIPDIIMEVDRNKVYTWANQAGLEFFGEDVLGKEAAFYFEGEQDTYDAVQPLFSGDENVIYVESWQRRKDGEKRLLAWWCRALKDDGGDVIGALSSARDITERRRQEAQILAAQAELQRLLAEADQSRRALLSVVEDQKTAEEEIRRLNEELERRVADRTAQLQVANKELETFSYSVSHDLRAPLRGIDGWSMALLEDYGDRLDEQARECLDRVRTEVQRMGQLIDDLLQLSRVTRADMRRELVDLTAMAHGIAARLKEAQPERQVEMIIQPGLTTQGDAHLLEIALTNLLGNAWKFTGARPLARIEFGHLTPCRPLLPGEGEGGRGVGGEVFYVRDNGVGFDMAYAQKLFGAFQRMHRASEFPGTGIGLATVQRIIHRHGGQVWAEAQVDQGATFYFTLE
jgi:PAS domain S-box-containing protein